MTKLGATI